MLCENCNKNEATIHYTEVINGVKNEHHLCGECMQEMNCGIDGDSPFSKLIKGILSAHMGNNGQETKEKILRIKCSKCGMDYKELTEKGNFGCSECYSIFGPLVIENIKEIQGSLIHTGKKYKKYIEHEKKAIEANYESIFNCEKVISENGYSNVKQIGNMELQLKEALKIEDYEEAARLRDAIKHIKEEM